MDTSTPTTNRMLFLFCGVAFAAPSLFFAFYTIRLLYINLTMEDAAAHRTGGMLIGAIAFPLAALMFGLISRYFIRKGLRAAQ
jgi:hypothetical protein